jgi:hypothetical protein
MSIIYNQSKLNSTDHEFDLLIQDILDLDEYFKDLKKSKAVRIPEKSVEVEKFPVIKWQAGTGG